MQIVQICPMTEVAANIAKQIFRCGNDAYGNNQYMCLPHKDRSYYVELCFNGNMGIQEKGKYYVKRQIILFYTFDKKGKEMILPFFFFAP